MLDSLRLSLVLKAIMAVTGLIMAAFVVFHLFNNAHIYFGREVYNRDGFAWKTPVVITLARPTLLISIVVHLVTGLALVFLNRSARPVGYEVRRYERATWMSRGMVFTGLVIGAYVAYHVLHAKVGVTHPELFERMDDAGRRDVYGLIIDSFLRPWVALAYIVGLAAIALHLVHGVQSIFSTLGVSNERNAVAFRALGWVIAAVVFFGYGSIPVAVMLGLLRSGG